MKFEISVYVVLAVFNLLGSLAWVYLTCTRDFSPSLGVLAASSCAITSILAADGALKLYKKQSKNKL
jgi:hypothetical protein